MTVQVLDEEDVRRIIREEKARPTFVTQKNVEAVVGLPRRDFLEAVRAKRFVATKEGRRIIARTADVVAYYEQRIALRETRPGNDLDILPALKGGDSGGGPGG